MGQAPIYDGINRGRLHSSKARQRPHPGPAIMRVGNHLAVACLLFGLESPRLSRDHLSNESEIYFALV
jgi:hypothetical protein